VAERGRTAVARPARAGTIGVGQTVADLVTAVAGRLSRLDAPKREANDLVAALLDVPRHLPLLKANKWLSSDVWSRALAAASTRAAGAPLAYAVGRASFRQLTLEVDARVLIPRPETELLVDLVLARVRPGGTAVDVGTGSGAIAIALATEGKFDRVVATDISTDALDVARANAERIGCAVEFMHGSLPRRSRAKRPPRSTLARAIVSNPPYIAFDEIGELPGSVRDWEPMIALVSGSNGMAATAHLVRGAADQLEPDGLLALEVDARRAALVAELVSADGRYGDISVQLDLSGRERFVLAVRRGRESRKGGGGRT
jgi:release factor glutamine methyltransferase